MDMAFPSRWAGILAVLGMAAGATITVRETLELRSSKSLLLRRARIEVVGWLIAAALVLFVLARVAVLKDQFVTPLEPLVRGPRTYDALYLLIFGAAKLLRWQGLATARVSIALAARPALVLSLSFAVMIVVGTLLLVLPFSLRSVEQVSVLDALFTMTSAVCVTGLAVNDIGSTYSAFGQLVILLGMQLGGIGIMTLAAFAFATAGLRAETRFAAMVGASSLAALKPTIRGVVLFTVGFELLGAALLFALWHGDPRFADRSVPWNAVFHSVAAFCNAGFSLFESNLVPFRQDTGVQVVIAALVILGGLGFPVLRELLGAGRLLPAWLLGRLLRRSGAPRIRLEHGTRVVLAASAVLLVLGASGVALLESGGVLADLPMGDRLVGSAFTSVTTRTAGFNTLPVGDMHPATLLLIMILMFIGGSPASTAGGIKTTTAAVLLATLRAEVAGTEPRLGFRSVPTEVRRRATAVTVLSGGIVVVSLGLLTLTDPAVPFLSLTFEAVSAFATTGLSTGVTPLLSPGGKLVLIATMFVGRVGPLTIALAVATRAADARYRLASEPVAVG